MIKVVNTVGRLDFAAGGTSVAVTRLCQHIGNIDGINVSLVSQARLGETIVPVQSSRVQVFIGRARTQLSSKLGIGFRRAFSSALLDGLPSILHDHGVWRPSNHHVARFAVRNSIPLVVHPHGMLEPWALAYRSRRKALALRLYARRNLESAALFFATAEQELENLRRLNITQPVAVVPLGVSMPKHAPLRSHSHPLKNAVFMSRIHPKKGLLNLIDAWAQVRPTDWRLWLAGPDENGHLAVVMRKVKALKLQDVVTYIGAVGGQKKAELLASADLFVLPSHSENFGVVVVEALAHAVPVIATKGTPWASLAESRSGWWVEPTLDGIAEALRQATTLDRHVLRQMGLRGYALARQFDWEVIAQRMADVYRWILGQGPRPECVVLAR